MLEAMAGRADHRPAELGPLGRVRRLVEAAARPSRSWSCPTGDDAAVRARPLRGLGSGSGSRSAPSPRSSRRSPTSPAVDLRPAADPAAAARPDPRRDRQHTPRSPATAPRHGRDPRPRSTPCSSELQAALVAPERLGSGGRALEDGEYERELAALFESYQRFRELPAAPTAEPGRGDDRSAAVRARSWGARPVLLYGFDDLTRAQLELIVALGPGRRGGDRGQLRRPPLPRRAGHAARRSADEPRRTGADELAHARPTRSGPASATSTASCSSPAPGGSRSTAAWG